MDKDTEINISEAAALMGSKKTPQKAAAARENGKKGGRPKGAGKALSQETKDKMRQARLAWLDRQRQMTSNSVRGESETGSPVSIAG